MGSIVVGVLVLLLKLVAWQMTGSIALYSDALESTVNVVTALAAYIAIRIALRPADKSHPYGHSKAEYFSAVLEGVMIIVAALLILREAIYGFMFPRELEAPIRGVMVNVLAGLINAAWAYILITRGKAYRSPALLADGQHLRTDVVSSLAVTIGVLLAIFTGWPWLDPLLALIVAVNILWSGWKVVASSLSGLMDSAVPDDELAKIRAIILDTADGAIEAHDLRTRIAGQMTFVDFHLVVDGSITVEAAHRICDRIEAALHEAIPDVQVTIHVEPEYKAHRSGAIVL